MLSPEQYKAKIEAARIASLPKESKANGLSQPAPDSQAVSLSPIPASVDKGIPTPGFRLPDNDEGTTKSDAVSESVRIEQRAGEASGNTETSIGLQHEGNSAKRDSTDVISSLVAVTNELVLQEIQKEKELPAAEAANITQSTPIIEDINASVTSIDPQEAYCEACGKSVEDCDCIPDEDSEADDETAILASLGISKDKQEIFKQKEDTAKEANGKDLDAIISSSDIEANTLSAAEIVAREYATTEDELRIFSNIFNQTTDKVKDLLPDQLEQKILHLDKAIKAIQAMQQACKRLATDKLDKETTKEKAERKEREKTYKVPRRRGSDEVDSTGALKTKEIGKLSKRDSLVKTLMLAGLTKEKAEAMADGN